MLHACPVRVKGSIHTLRYADTLGIRHELQEGSGWRGESLLSDCFEGFWARSVLAVFLYALLD